MPVTGIIPARLQSSRLPRKLLQLVAGKPLIQHTWENALRCRELDSVLIAVDSAETEAVCREFGAEVVMTAQHPSGTDRVAEVVRQGCLTGSDSLLINLQGDEPELDPSVISNLVQAMQQSGAEMGTVAAPLSDPDRIQDPSCVKVVVAADGRALYFSRSVIPHSRDSSIADCLDRNNRSPWLLHIGLYAYRADFLLELTQQPPSPLEQLECLEQLRALEFGARIQVIQCDQTHPGIDTPEDLESFRSRLEEAVS